MEIRILVYILTAIIFFLFITILDVVAQIIMAISAKNKGLIGDI